MRKSSANKTALTQAERLEKSRLYAGINGEQAAKFAREGNEILAAAWARNAASCALHIVGRE